MLSQVVVVLFVAIKTSFLKAVGYYMSARVVSGQTALRCAS
jgi:hypothetical protein